MQSLSAKEYIPDEIYTKKDPIAASMKLREDEGSIFNTVKKSSNQSFFFTLTAIGEECPVAEPMP